MINKQMIVVLLIYGLLLTPFTFASDFQSPRTAGLGGAGHASPLLGDAIYQNPSFASYAQVHSLSFNYGNFRGGEVNTPLGPSEFYGHNMNISVLDGTQEALFQAGVGYTRREDVSLIHVAGSKNVSKRVSVGAGVKMIFPNDMSGSRIMDGTLSVTWITAPWLQLALIGDNLFNAGTSKGFYPEYTLGTKINIMSGMLMIYIDPHLLANLPVGKDAFGYEAGVELPLATDIFIRAGKFQNSNAPFQYQLADGFGVGIGWVGPKLALEYSFSRTSFPMQTNAHTAGMSLFF
jgi:hypothetical protein